jgi:hypothetical protein
MKKSLGVNHEAYLNIKTVVANRLNRFKFPEEQKGFDVGKERLKAFLGSYGGLLEKLLLLERAEEGMGLGLGIMSVAQVGAMDAWKDNLMDRLKWYLKDVGKGIEMEDFEKVVRGNCGEKPVGKEKIKLVVKKLGAAIGKYFKGLLKEIKQDAQRHWIESVLDGETFTKFITVFDSKASWADNVEEKMGKWSLNELLGKPTTSFAKMTENVEYPEKDTFKSVIDKLTKNLEKIFGQKKRLLTLVSKRRKLGAKADKKAKESPKDDKDDPTAAKKDKVLASMDKVYAAIDKKLDNEDKTKKDFQEEFGKDDTEFRKKIAEYILDYDRASDNKIKSQSDCEAALNGIKYPCEGNEDCPDTDFESDVVASKKTLKKHKENCFKTKNSKDWLKSLKS